jgi:hypothetical protein
MRPKLKSQESLLFTANVSRFHLMFKLSSKPIIYTSLAYFPDGLAGSLALTCLNLSQVEAIKYTSLKRGVDSHSAAAHFWTMREKKSSRQQPPRVQEGDTKSTRL